ncbi:hypothetical protein PF010_g30691 [Phytophthora fragariae]|uniref:Secreted protein n=1 Tax=Phytophthora fragariae TaxID=53985 RepID=A0A6A4EQD6_9STRA|nr:hypothetical protein PF003_g23661 [Phytophthora fragariae]KAE9059252.1 hypothetical protein PF010_g30691 [Phytophthora fragariae]KAE9154451.1 hypothetical protein PF006_g1492 [Phytophthora fragariae]KAE9291805.1 hypothetical protein PF008_g25238 [Phytophthora fragariae]KAE9327854.1 hypothetical protein PF001_g1692 [Phytophthora fragariae]
MRFIRGCLLIAVPCFACHQPRDQQQPRDHQQHQHCRGRCKVSSACMRFICGYLLIDVPCFAFHQPRLDGTELATSAPPPRPAAATAAAPALPDEAHKYGAGAR